MKTRVLIGHHGKPSWIDFYPENQREIDQVDLLRKSLKPETMDFTTLPLQDKARPSALLTVIISPLVRGS